PSSSKTILKLQTQLNTTTQPNPNNFHRRPQINMKISSILFTLAASAATATSHQESTPRMHILCPRLANCTEVSTPMLQKIVKKFCERDGNCSVMAPKSKRDNEAIATVTQTVTHANFVTVTARPEIATVTSIIRSTETVYATALDQPSLPDGMYRTQLAKYREMMEKGMHELPVEKEADEAVVEAEEKEVEKQEVSDS
ncbi:hypothetical protein P280DRAFT_540213, partial [Massarina eburnea CBS 473.64]